MKIMTVEDSEFEQKIIVDFLQKGGYADIVEATSAEQAITKFKQQKPDLVLMDIRLPRMDGLECFEELKKINPLVNVIMLTIVMRKDAIEKAHKLGAVDYIVKPVTETKLLKAVKAVEKKLKK